MVVIVKVKDAFVTELADLEVALERAIEQCNRTASPSHMVRNCPSDLQANDMAWRHRQNIEYQIKTLKANHD